MGDNSISKGLKGYPWLTSFWGGMGKGRVVSRYGTNIWSPIPSKAQVVSTLQAKIMIVQ